MTVTPKIVAEAVRYTKADPANQKPKTYTNPRHGYRTQDERLNDVKHLLLSHMHPNDYKELVDAVNLIHTAFYRHGAHQTQHWQAQEHHHRMVNLTGYLADVLGHGVQFSRAYKNNALPAEDHEHATRIGFDNALKMAMNAYAHELLPAVSPIHVTGRDYVRVDQDSPQVGNHAFILSTLGKALLPKERLSEEKVLGSHIIGDSIAFFRNHRNRIRANFENIGAIRGLKYDHETAPFVDKALDWHAALTGNMDYVKAVKGVTQNAPGSKYKPDLDYYKSGNYQLNPTAHEKYKSELTDPRGRAMDQYIQAIRNGDQEAIHSALVAYRRALARQTMSIPPASQAGTRSRSLPTIEINKPATGVHPHLLGDDDIARWKKEANVKFNQITAKPIRHEPDVRYGDPLIRDFTPSVFKEPDRNDSGGFKGFASTLAAKQKPDDGLVSYQRGPSIQAPFGKAVTRNIPYPSPYDHKGNRIQTSHTLTTPSNLDVGHVDIKGQEPRIIHDPLDIDIDHPVKSYPETIPNYTFNEPKTELDGVPYRTSDRLSLPAPAKAPTPPIVAAIKDRLAQFKYEEPSQKIAGINVPDFKHRTVDTSVKPSPGPDFGLNPLHDLVMKSAKLSTSVIKTPDEARAMVSNLGPSPEAEKLAGRKYQNNPKHHAAKMWSELHSVVMANPELHSDLRAHAGLHYSRMVYDHHAKSGWVDNNEEHGLHQSSSMLFDLANAMDPQKGNTIHPALKEVAAKHRERAEELYNRAPLISPTFNRLKRSVKADLMKRARRIARSPGGVRTKELVGKIGDTLKSQKWFQHAVDRLKDFNFESTQEERDAWVKFITEDEKWDADLFGWAPPKKNESDGFDEAVYHAPRGEGGLGIPRHPNPRTVAQIAKEDYLLKSDPVSQHLIKIGTDYLAAKKTRSDKAANRAREAIRHALEDRSREVRELHRTEYKTEPDGKGGNRLILPEPAAINSVGKVVELMGHIQDHLAHADPADKKVVTHPELDMQINQWRSDHFDLGHIVSKAVKSIAPNTKKLARGAVSAARSAVSDLASDAGSIVFGVRKKFIPRSTPAKLITRAAIALPYAIGDVADKLSGPDILSGNPSQQKAIRVARDREYKNKLANVGMFPDPKDKADMVNREKALTKQKVVKMNKSVSRLKAARAAAKPIKVINLDD